MSMSSFDVFKKFSKIQCVCVGGEYNGTRQPAKSRQLSMIGCLAYVIQDRKVAQAPEAPHRFMCPFCWL